MPYYAGSRVVTYRKDLFRQAGVKTPTTLGDVAKVAEDHQPLIGDAVTAEPALFVVIQKFPEADTQTVTKEIRELREREEISEAAKQAILRDNAARFYKLAAAPN